MKQVVRIGIVGLMSVGLTACGSNKLNLESDMNEYTIDNNGQVGIMINENITSMSISDELSTEQEDKIYNKYAKEVNPDFKLKVKLGTEDNGKVNLATIKDDKSIKYTLDYNKEAYNNIGLDLVDHGPVKIDQAKLNTAVTHNIEDTNNQIDTNKQKIENLTASNDEVYQENKKQIKHVEDKINTYEQLKADKGDPDGTLSLYIKDYEKLLKQLKANPASNLEFNQVKDCSSIIEDNNSEIGKLEKMNKQLKDQVSKDQKYLSNNK